VAWPSHEELWQENLPAAQLAFIKLCQAIADPDPGTGAPRGERLHVLVPNDNAARAAKEALAGLGAELHSIRFGDIWLRDTAPIFLTGPRGVAAARFGFNGWGGKYELPHDDEVSKEVTAASGLPSYAFDFVLEGGSVEVDGQGTVLTTRQCLLNPNRNPGMSQAELEGALKDSLGAEKVLWLGDGLLNDHTDGHIDTVARFVAEARVVCMHPSGADDPNRDVLERLARDLGAFRDARGRTLDVVRIPSPGLIRGEDGEVMPASYVNFYIGNRTVVVPTYGSKWDDEAVAAVGRLFPGRRAVGLDARAILTGGGAFHCITQQVPEPNPRGPT
jgi:agmatine deiminase